MLIEAIAVGKFKIVDDEVGIADCLALIFDVEHLGLGSFAHIIAADDGEGKFCHAQVGFELGTKGAGVGQAEAGRKLVEGDRDENLWCPHEF
jgi:hypothetical protein